MESGPGTKSEWILYEQVIYKAQVVSVAEAQPQPVTRRATCDGEYLLRVAAYTHIYIYIFRFAFFLMEWRPMGAAVDQGATLAFSLDLGPMVPV